VVDSAEVASQVDNNELLIRAVQRATRKLASTGKFDDVLRDVLAICVEAVGAENGTIYLHDSAQRRLKFQHVLPSDIADRLPVRDIADDFGVAGLAFQSRRSVTRDYPEKPRDAWNEFERATGVPVRSIIATPLSMEDEEPVGVVQLINKDEGGFTESDIAVLDIVSAVATMAFLNAQLIDEQARASTLLGMGKVSHDIGNLAASLYATLSFGEMAMGGLNTHLLSGKPDRTVRMYVDTLEPFFRELKSSVDRIVGYSQLISDMSAGRPIRPVFQRSSLAENIYTSAALFETQGRAEHIRIVYDIDYSAPETFNDELFIVRIVQNLVGNAIKAVRETLPEDLPEVLEDGEPSEYYGEIQVCYRVESDTHVIEVRDTGPGMSEDTIERILQGKARSEWGKAGGSGWGLKIVLELTAALQGRVQIESQVGRGTKFRVEIPTRDEA